MEAVTSFDGRGRALRVAQVVRAVVRALGGAVGRLLGAVGLARGGGEPSRPRGARELERRRGVLREEKHHKEALDFVKRTLQTKQEIMKKKDEKLRKKKMQILDKFVRDEGQAQSSAERRAEQAQVRADAWHQADSPRK